MGINPPKIHFPNSVVTIRFVKSIRCYNFVSLEIPGVHIDINFLYWSQYGAKHKSYEKITYLLSPFSFYRLFGDSSVDDYPVSVIKPRKL